MPSLNPMVLIDSMLSDWASPRVRRLIHSLILLAVVIGGIWLASDGDWAAFAGAVLAALYAASNVANTPAVELDAAGADTEPDDDLSYEEAGGQPLPDGSF